MSRNNEKIEIDLDGVSRRKLLALTSAGLATGLAGCTGGDGDGTPTEGNGDTDTPTPGNGNGDTDTPTQGNGDTDTPTQEPIGPEDLRDATIDATDGNTPEEVNMNRFALNTGYHWIVREYYALSTNSMTEPFWVIYEDDGTYYDPDTATFHYKVKEDEYYWANGDPITAETFYREFQVGQLQNPPEQRAHEEVTLHNDWEWSVTYENAANPLTLAPTSGRLAANPGYEQEWLERLEDVSNADEREEVSADIVNTRISMQEFIDEGMSSSVWAPVEMDERSVTFEKNEHHPWADEFVYDELIAHTCDGAACDEMIENDRIDVGMNRFPEELRSVSPDHLQTVSESRALASRNLYFRYLNDHIANRWVRRAMLTVLDLNFLVDFWQGEGGFIKQHQTGMAAGSEARFLDQDFIDSLYNYPIEGDEELAAEFMREGGYTKDGNQWVNDEGESVDFHFAAPSGSLYETLAEAINDVWQGFGLDPTYTPRDFGYLVPNLQDGTGDIDVTLWATGWSRGVPQDYFSPTNPFFLHLYTTGTDDYQSWLDEGIEKSQNNGRPIILELPEDPSDIYREGPTREINYLELWDEFINTRDEERAVEIIKLFVRYFNFDLPRPDLFPQINALWGDTQDFNWAEDSDFYHAVPNQSKHLVHRFGVMEGVPE